MNAPDSTLRNLDKIYNNRTVIIPDHLIKPGDKSHPTNNVDIGGEIIRFKEPAPVETEVKPQSLKLTVKKSR